MENQTQESIETEAKKEFRPEKEKHVGLAIIAYLLFFVPLLTEAKDDVFVKYHVKQGFVLFLSAVITNIISISPLPFIGILLQFGLVILFFIGIINVLHEKKEPLPFIGQFADKFTF